MAYSYDKVNFLKNHNRRAINQTKNVKWRISYQSLLLVVENIKKNIGGGGGL